MNVLRLTPFFHHETVGGWPPEFDPVGGQQIQCRAISLAMAKVGIEQRVVTLGFPGIPDRYSLDENITVHRARSWMPAVRSRTTGLVGLTLNWRLSTPFVVRRLNREGWAPDIAHVHADGQIDALKIALWTKHVLQLPTVVTLHCSRLATYEPMHWLDRLRHNKARGAEVETATAADAVTVLNRRTAERVQHEAPAASVSVIPDVLDVESFRQAAQSDGSRSSPRQRRVLAFVGRIAHEKGWPVLVDILADERMRNWNLLVVGDGPERHALQHMARKRGVNDRMMITGFQSHARVAQLLGAADAAVLPSRHEEFGGVALEAMALGVPMAAFAVGGLVHTIGQIAPRFLVEPGDVAGLVDLFMAVEREEPFVSDFRHAGYQWVQRFCPSVLASELIHIYENVLRRNLRLDVRRG